MTEGVAATLTVWADADSLPAEARRVIANRAASELSRGRSFKAVFVANRPIPLKKGPGVEFVQVEAGPGKADDYIIERMSPGDLVVTRDIPLAERALSVEGAAAINHKGARFTAGSIAERRSLRDAMLELRLSGLAESGKSQYGPRDLKAFSDAFDRAVTELLRSRE
jgi:uncharacterized protein YaiI (UPF0178 family)